MKLFFKRPAKKQKAYSNGLGPKTESEVTLPFSEEISFENRFSIDESTVSSVEKGDYFSDDLKNSFRNGIGDNDVSESDGDSFKSLNEKFSYAKNCVKQKPILTPVQSVKEPKTKWTEKIKAKFQTKTKFSKIEEEIKELNPNLQDVAIVPQTQNNSICSGNMEYQSVLLESEASKLTNEIFQSDLLNVSDATVEHGFTLNDTVTETVTSNDITVVHQTETSNDVGTSDDGITWLTKECTLDLSWESKNKIKIWERKKPLTKNIFKEQPVNPIGMILYDEDDDIPQVSIKTLLRDKELKEKRQKELESFDHEAFNRDRNLRPKTSSLDLTFFPSNANRLHSTTNELTLLPYSEKYSNETLKKKEIFLNKASNNLEHASNQKNILLSPNPPESTKHKGFTEQHATINYKSNEGSHWTENKCSNVLLKKPSNLKSGHLKDPKYKKKVSFVDDQQNVETLIPEVIKTINLNYTSRAQSARKSRTSLIETSLIEKQNEDSERKTSTSTTSSKLIKNYGGSDSGDECSEPTSVEHSSEQTSILQENVTKKDKVLRQKRKLAFIDTDLQQKEKVILAEPDVVKKNLIHVKAYNQIITPQKLQTSTKDTTFLSLYPKETNKSISQESNPSTESKFITSSPRIYLQSSSGKQKDLDTDVMGAESLQNEPKVNQNAASYVPMTKDKSLMFLVDSLGKNLESEGSPLSNGKDDFISLVSDKKRVADEIKKLKTKTADLKKIEKHITKQAKHTNRQEPIKCILEKKYAKKCEILRKENAKAYAILQSKLFQNVEQKSLECDIKDNVDEELKLLENSIIFDAQLKSFKDNQSTRDISDKHEENITKELFNQLSLNKLKEEYKLIKKSLKDFHENKITDIEALYTLKEKTIIYKQAFFDFSKKIMRLIKKHENKEKLFEVKKNKELKKMENEKKKLPLNEFDECNQSNSNLSESKKNWLNCFIKKISKNGFGIKNKEKLKVKTFKTNKQLTTNPIKDAKHQGKSAYSEGVLHSVNRISNSPLPNLSNRLKEARTSATFRLFQTNENHGFVFPKNKIRSILKKKKNPIRSHYRNSTSRRKNIFKNNIHLNTIQRKSGSNSTFRRVKKSKKIISLLKCDLEKEKIRRIAAEELAFKKEKKYKKYRIKLVAMKQELGAKATDLKLYKEKVNSNFCSQSSVPEKQFIKAKIEPNYMLMAFDTIDKHIGIS